MDKKNLRKQPVKGKRNPSKGSLDLEKQEKNDELLQSLLSPGKVGASKTPKKSRQKVQWSDRNGDQLVEVLEFEPSDASDTDDDELDSCICIIM